MKSKITNLKYPIVLLFAILLPSCELRKNESVDFTDLSAGQGMAFQVIGQHETNLDEGLPYNCYMMDGTPVIEYSDESDEPSNGPRKTNSVTGTAVVQQLLQYGKQNKVIEIVGTYPSTNSDKQAVTLSGKVMLPKDGHPKRLIIVSHYTVGSNAEAPSNCFSLEGVLVKMGYGLIIPDYLGYGVSSHTIHPYLVMETTAINVADMYFAVKPWLKAVGMEPEEEEVILMGYSQGGATTMALEYLAETRYNDPKDTLQHMPIHRVFAGGGPYDVKSTYERFVNTDLAGYPVAVPLVLQGMIKGNNLQVQMSDMIKPKLLDHVDDWINSKRYTTAQINKLIGTTVTHELLTDEAMEQTSDNVAELYKAMLQNSIVSFNWQPQAPVYIMHSIDDETVPYTNATNAKAKWASANITYNFGHYGGHAKTALRFIYSVQTLLQQEEEERKKYE